MPIPEIEEFAKILVQLVRDSSIQVADRMLQLGSKSPTAERWRHSLKGSSPEEFARTIIPDIVDVTIFYLLDAIDNEGLKLSFSAKNGKVVDLTRDGLSELAGWYVGSESWRALYSKERIKDDCSDIELS